jgi:LacI family transcriptional regulator
VLSGEFRPDAIVAANDLIGIGVIRAAEDFGLSVPGDIAVTGIDNTELAGVVRPGLTSVDLGADERGRAAAELLLQRITDPARPAHTIAVAPSLVVRGSSLARRPDTASSPTSDHTEHTDLNEEREAG